jgi:hypothetical protein
MPTTALATIDRRNCPPEIRVVRKVPPHGMRPVGHACAPHDDFLCGAMIQPVVGFENATAPVGPACRDLKRSLLQRVMWRPCQPKSVPDSPASVCRRRCAGSRPAGPAGGTYFRDGVRRRFSANWPNALKNATKSRISSSIDFAPATRLPAGLAARRFSIASAAWAFPSV